MSKPTELPPLPEKRDLSPFSESHIYGYAEADMRAYAREAVRLNAKAVPDGYSLVDREALDMAINALRRDANEGRPIRGEIADRLSAAPAAPQPAQQPLTDEQIEAIYTQETGSLIDDSPWALVDFVRAIEQAHGIGVKND